MRHGLEIITTTTQFYLNRSGTDAYIFLRVACDPNASCVVSAGTNTHSLGVGRSFAMHWVVGNGDALEIVPSGGSVAYELETEFLPTG